MKNIVFAGRLVMAAIATVVLAGGCSQTNVATEASHAAADVTHDLHGYWCVEHGIPEDICAQCNSKVAAEFQQKGDWCDEHSRPDSQCFVCHPEFEDKFASQYEAKFGEKPPAPPGE